MTDPLKKLATKIVRVVLDDLLDRKGLRHAWDATDQRTKAEVRKCLVTLVLRELNGEE
jgi:hypothetical protein